jgi:hypothetical protein
MPQRSLARVAVVAAILAASSALAADLDALKNTTPAERAKAQTAMMKTKLGLTDAEMAKIGPINLKYAEQMEPIIKGSEGPLIKLRSARTVEDAKEAELKGVLTPDQFTKFQAGKEEMKEKLVQQIEADRAKGK